MLLTVITDGGCEKLVGALQPLRAPFKWLMKQRPLTTALLSKCTESTHPNTHLPLPQYTSGSSISFTYRVKAVSQQMTVFVFERNIPECFLFGLIGRHRECNAITSYILSKMSIQKENLKFGNVKTKFSQHIVNSAIESMTMLTAL